MKKILTVSLIVVFCITIHAKELKKDELQDKGMTPMQKLKLKSPMTKETKMGYIVEAYNGINFNKAVFFDAKPVDKIYLKTSCSIDHQTIKDVISKENFIATCASLSDQVTQSIFMSPQYMSSLLSSEWLIQVPQKIDIMISLMYTKEGININVKTGLAQETNKTIVYEKLFNTKF